MKSDKMLVGLSEINAEKLYMISVSEGDADKYAIKDYTLGQEEILQCA